MYKQKIIDEINRLTGEGYTIKDVFKNFEDKGIKNVDGKSFTYDGLRYFIKKNISSPQETETETKTETNIKEKEPKMKKKETKKTRKGKINYDKISKIIDLIYENPSLTIQQLADNVKTNISAVSKVRKCLNQEWIKKTEDTPLPSEYFVGNSITAYVTKKMFDIGFISK